MENPRGNWTSASSASRDKNCPGAHLAQQGLPEPPAGEGAESGKRIHAALKNSSNTAILNSLSVKEREIFDSCRVIEKKLVLEWFGPDHPPMEVDREERLWVRFFNYDLKSEYQHSGEPDAIYHAGAKALIVDYKTGSGDVDDATDNLQLRDLVCLFRGDQMRQGKPVVECATAIIQPLVTYEPVICSYNEPAMDRAAIEMMARIASSNNPKSPRLPGNHCKYCKAALANTCVEHQQWASATLPSFRDIMSAPVTEWTPDQRQIFCERHQVAKEWLESTWKAMQEGAANDPNFVPGWSLQDGVVKHPIEDVKTLITRFCALGGKPEQLAPALRVIKDDLADCVKAVTKLKGVALTKAYNDLIDGITVAKPNKPSLKKEAISWKIKSRRQAKLLQKRISQERSLEGTESQKA